MLNNLLKNKKIIISAGASGIGLAIVKLLLSQGATVYTCDIDKKNINPNEVLNSDLLKKLKLINKNSKKLKILGTGEVKDKINIEADLASKSAIEKLEKIGGSIQLKK